MRWETSRGFRAPVTYFVTVAILLFIGGAYAGLATERSKAIPRIQAYVAWKLGLNLGASSQVEKNTLVVKLSTSVVRLPNADGKGGAIQPLEDGRILHVSSAGRFTVLSRSGSAKVLPIDLETNVELLKQHRVWTSRRFYPDSFRVTGLNLRGLEEGRYEILVAHHFYNAEEQCIELRLSRGVVRAKAEDLVLEQPFRAVVSTTPCITFFDDRWYTAFEGHMSGGRIVRLNERLVLFSTGDHGWSGVSGYPALARDDRSTLGKILLVDIETGRIDVYAKGVRNPQGLAVDSEGRIWETEHGPRGGDELNLIAKGGDYGWPDSTLGTDYGPRPWPRNGVQGRHGEGMSPQYAWIPSIGVSGLIAVSARQFPLWRGDLLVLSIAGQAMHRLRLEGTRVVYDERIGFDGHLLRDIAELPDGRLALLTDHGKVIFVSNADGEGGRPFLDPSTQQKTSPETTVGERVARLGEGPPGSPVLDKSPAIAAISKRATIGAGVYQAHCAECHSIRGEVSVGPSLKGIIGRPVGSTEFGYSAALLEAKGSDTWTAGRILQFVSAPGSLYPGTTMQGVPLTAKEERDLSAFLDFEGR